MGVDDAFFTGQTAGSRRIDPQHLPPRIVAKEPKMGEVETARALALMMREAGIQALTTPDGYMLSLAPQAVKPRVSATPSKAAELEKTAKELAEDEEAMLFAHLG
jgi:hypothetical protein